MRSAKLCHFSCLQVYACLAGEIENWQKIPVGRRNKGYLTEHITKTLPLATASKGLKNAEKAVMRSWELLLGQRVVFHFYSVSSVPRALLGRAEAQHVIHDQW